MVLEVQLNKNATLKHVKLPKTGETFASFVTCYMHNCLSIGVSLNTGIL